MDDNHICYDSGMLGCTGPLTISMPCVLNAQLVVQMSLLSIILRAVQGTESTSTMFRVTVPVVGFAASSLAFLAGTQRIILLVDAFAPSSWRFLRLWSFLIRCLYRVGWTLAYVSYVMLLPNALVVTIASHTKRFDRFVVSSQAVNCNLYR